MAEIKTEKEQIIYDPDTLIDFYKNSLNSSFDRKLLLLKGFYQDNNGKEYSGFYYDSIRDKNNNAKITLRLKSDLKSILNDGGFYQIKGYINRTSTRNSSIGIAFNVTDVEKKDEAIQLISEQKYNIIKDRYDKGLFNVETYFLKNLYNGHKPKILIITGNESIVMSDFKSELKAINMYDINIERTNLSSKNEILNTISNLREVELIAFVRGGGSGLHIFDDEDLCKKILDLKIPFVTALGHAEDKTLLEKISDKSFSTPSTFGTFLQSMTILDYKRKSETQNKNKQLKNLRLIIFVLVVIVIIIISKFFFKP